MLDIWAGARLSDSALICSITLSTNNQLLVIGFQESNKFNDRLHHIFRRLSVNSEGIFVILIIFPSPDVLFQN